MTEEQIKQNADNYTESLMCENLHRTMYSSIDFIAGAHSLDEEIKELKEEIESLQEQYNTCFDGFKKRGTKLGELMKENVKLRNPWISVEDKLPEKIHNDCDYSVECLVHCYDKEAEWNTVAQYNYAQCCWDLSDYDYDYETVVQFWIPIPELKE